MTARSSRALKLTLTALAVLTTTTFLSGCNEDKSQAQGGVSPQVMADAIHTVIESDRTAYTKFIVNRLTIEENVIKASEHWKDEKALLLPAQMFRAGAEIAQEKNASFTYALLSQWPINEKNKPRTTMETLGLEAVGKNPTSPFYGEEELGGKKYFTAVYPDVAVAEACVKCHNEHKDSPRTDFKIGDVMGGVVIRFPM